ncbi:hypothetical protein FOB64_005750 [Candida albicans]|uniref:Uncharacterized protein n=1 Tax=Candida albicans TaxID=5476 RepID=A0A8H6F053_CANAX|nr:hypothetical protein FOB64_005750 [Candida albicans]
MILSIFISISSCSSSSHSNSHSHSTSMSISSSASTLPIIHIKDDIDELTYFDLTSITTSTVYKINNDQALVYENNQWIHVQTTSTPIIHSKFIPISHCLNQKWGDGGAIDFQTTTIYTMINTFDLALTLSIIFYYEKLTHSWEFSKVLTLRDIYYCSVAPGEIGQIWIDLQYHEFKSIKYRILENFPKFTIHNKEESNNNKVISSKNRKKKFLSKKKLKFGKWKEISKMFLLNGKKSPIISCITTNDNKDKQLDCEGKSLLKLKEFKMF